MLLACALPAQVRPPAAAPATPSAGKGSALPPFSGTWLLDRQRTHLQREQLPQGESRAVIEYDGKTWHYVHTHLEAVDVLPDSWQIRLVVGSPKFQAEPGDGMMFRSRIERIGNTLVMHENGSDPNHQHVYNTVTYSLQDNGNTLIQEEHSKGPLGTVVNHWVLKRAGTGAATGAEAGG